MTHINKYIMTFERYSYRKRLKHRKERKKQEKSNRNRIEREKGFGSDDPVNPGETISRLQ